MDENEHLLVTPPDRFYGDAIKILLIDWNPVLLDQLVAALKGCKEKIVIYYFASFDTEFRWIVDVANEVDIVVMDISNNSQLDLIKGHLIGKKQVHYFGRSDVEKMFFNFTKDPISTILIKIAEKLTISGEKNEQL